MSIFEIKLTLNSDSWTETNRIFIKNLIVTHVFQNIKLWQNFKNFTFKSIHGHVFFRLYFGLRLSLFSYADCVRLSMIKRTHRLCIAS